MTESGPKLRSFERLGQRVARVMDDYEPEDRQLLEQRARLVRWAAEPRPSPWQRFRRAALVIGGAPLAQLRAGWLVSGATVFAVTLALVVWKGSPTQQPESHVVADGRADLEALSPAVMVSAEPPPRQEQARQRPLPKLLGQHAGQTLADQAWIAATDDVAQISFSDQSSIALQAGARARVVALDERGLRMILESGHLDATITPNTGYRWTIQAGPYQVQVLGTVFAVDWSSEEHRLTVDVSRGKVRVTNPERAEADDRVLVAGESLTISVAAAASADDSAERIDSDAPSASGGSRGDDERVTALREQRDSMHQAKGVGVAKPIADERAKSVETVGPEPTSLRSATAEWKTLAKSGQYAKALAAARAAGFDAIVAQASASDLLLLADTARLGRSPTLARQTLLSLRKRFPGHANATVAAFSLGRLASEVQHDDALAVKWFRAYLSGAPSGTLAEGARGRLLMAYQRLGQRSAAQKAAKDYLDHHPSGPHANLARSLLDD